MSLRKKLVIGYFLAVIILLSLLVVVFFVQINNNREKTIKSNLEELVSYSVAAVKQSIYINGMEADENGFANAAAGSAEEIRSMLGCGVACYTPDGELIFSTYGDQGTAGKEKNDLLFAVKGNNAYTIVKENGTMKAYISTAVRSAGKTVGIIRIQQDYTETFKDDNTILITITVSSGIVLAVVGALLVIMLIGMLSPIKELSEKMKVVAMRPEDAETIKVTNADEIGTLTRQYNKMALTIRSQIVTIKKESERLTKTLEYKKVFYDNLTHELKTPLTIIIGYAEMMDQTDFDDVAFARKGTTEIIKEGKRLRNMVVGLLEASRGMTEVYKFKKTDMLALISEIVDSMNIKAERYGQLITLDACDAWVYGSENRLKQLYVNLIDNAIKYGSTSRSIHVTMEKLGGDLIISIENAIEKGRDFDSNEKIFLPFYRSRDVGEREEGSVGLGLSICKNIIDEHSGSIEADENGGIVTFTTVLPMWGDFIYDR